MNALYFVIPRMLVLLRGLPGSGKSTLAAAVAAASAAVAAESESSAANPVVASADDFFVDADGKYQVGSGCSLLKSVNVVRNNHFPFAVRPQPGWEGARVVPGKGICSFAPTQFLRNSIWFLWVLVQVRTALTRGHSPVLVDNTNTQSWEMHPYARMASERGYSVLLLEPGTPWRRRIAELARRTRHRVPKDKIALMDSRMDDFVVAAEDVCKGLPENFR